MADLYLGLIALGVLVMAAIQVGAMVAALRAARRVGEMASRFEQDVRPIVANLQKVSEEAARASALAAAQVDRLDTLVTSVARRVEDTAATVQQTILQPARDGLALLNTLKNVIASFRDQGEPRAAQEPREPEESRPARPAARRGGQGAPDEDLFIG
ncbi:MAG TPA: hypothetical protein VFD69_15175 [Vicinamibacterales bacterium]|nr:hypothetical protein [Vicinamibacterales bacterium]